MKIKSLLSFLVLGAAICLNAADPAAAPAPSAPQSPAVQSAPAQNAVEAPAAAPKKQAQPARSQGGIFANQGMIIIIVIFFLMIFFSFRSNKKQQQKRQEMLDRIVKGTRVMLNSGVYGNIVEVREKSFLVEIAPNVRIEVIKNGIASNEDAAAGEPKEKTEEKVEKKG